MNEKWQQKHKCHAAKKEKNLKIKSEPIHESELAPTTRLTDVGIIVIGLVEQISAVGINRPLPCGEDIPWHTCSWQWSLS